MRAHFEKVTFEGASLLTFERIGEEFPMYWHYHPEFQLTLMVDSQGQRLVGDGVADYASGDLVLLGPNLPHSWRTRPRAGQSHHAVDVQFGAGLFGEHLFSIAEMKPVLGLLQRSATGLAFGQTKTGRAVARTIADLPSLSPARRLISVLDILLQLSEESEARALSTDSRNPVCRVEDQRRMDKICSYLRDHYEEEIDFAALAQIVHMDQASLCRFFKKATGNTMTHYVNTIRVGVATKMLTETDLSVLEIGFTVGFGNYSNFHRQFKQIKGHGPRVARQQFPMESGRPQARRS